MSGLLCPATHLLPSWSHTPWTVGCGWYPGSGNRKEGAEQRSQCNYAFTTQASLSYLVPCYSLTDDPRLRVDHEVATRGGVAAVGALRSMLCAWVRGIRLRLDSFPRVTCAAAGVFQCISSYLLLTSPDAPPAPPREATRNHPRRRHVDPVI